MSSRAASLKLLIPAWILLAIFGGVGLKGVWDSAEPFRWEKVACGLTRFEPLRQPGAERPFSARVEFAFEWDGEPITGTALGIAGWRDSREWYDVIERLGGLPASHCWVPDGDPLRAVLFRPPVVWSGFLFTGFASIVGWILVQAHRHRDEANEVVGRKVTPALALLFGGGGLVMLAALSLPVWIESLATLGYERTRATVVWNESYRSGDGRKARLVADVGYEYEVGGRSWLSNHVRPGIAVGADAARKQYPVGSVTTCFHDPDRPERAVLRRGPGWSGLATLFPLPFLVVGAVCLRPRKTDRSRSKGRR